MNIHDYHLTVVVLHSDKVVHAHKTLKPTIKLPSGYRKLLGLEVISASHRQMYPSLDVRASNKLVRTKLILCGNFKALAPESYSSAVEGISPVCASKSVRSQTGTDG